MTLRFRILIRRISRCSRFFWLSVLPWCREKLQIAMVWLDWVGPKSKLNARLHFFFYHKTQVTNLATFTSMLVTKFVFYSPWWPKLLKLGAGFDTFQLFTPQSDFNCFDLRTLKFEVLICPNIKKLLYVE